MVSSWWSVVSAKHAASPRRRVTTSLLIFAFCFLPFALQATAQTTSTDAAAADLSFAYKFENPRFYVSTIEIDLAANGTGELRFKRGESDEIIDRKLQLLPTTTARIRTLYQTTQFLTSSEEYQTSKDFSHLGWMTLTARQGERERKARFNYTMNLDIRELTDIFRAIATQEMDLFDIEVAEQYQPLDLPRLVETLENDLRLLRIAEPERLLAKLQEIANNDTQPLIARNHAARMIDSIKKGKFKSPIKK